MILPEEAIEFHNVLIQTFGGSNGLRNREALESALLRPFQTFNEQELYPNPEDKAAAILESIVNNHPFIDGNKRIGFILFDPILNLKELVRFRASWNHSLNEFKKLSALPKLKIGFENTTWEEVIASRENVR